MSKPLSNRRKIASFVSKLIDMLDDEQAIEVIDKQESGNGFTISSTQKFTQNILPRYFNHSNLSSFIRQLNMYGFKKLKQEEGGHTYTHQNFEIGNNASLKKIKRKVNKQEDETEISGQGEIVRVVQSKELEEIRIKHQEIEKRCNSLIEENEQLMTENYRLIQALHRQEKQKQFFQMKLRQLLEIYSRTNCISKNEDDLEQLQNQSNAGQQVIHDEISLNSGFLSIQDFINIPESQISIPIPQPSI